MHPFFPTLPNSVAYACVAAESVDARQLHPLERELIPPSASKKYIAAFVAGRVAAREALGKLGVTDDSPILRGERGMPLWPSGVRGSLTHKQGLAAALVARSEDFAAVGMDLEINAAARHPRFACSICTASERRWLEEYRGDRDSMLLSIFSAKETIFKALYPICRRYFGFQAAELRWDGSRGVFNGVLLETLHPQLERGFSLEIGLHQQSDLLLSHLLLPTPPRL